MSHLNEDPLVSPRSALIFRAQILGKSPHEERAHATRSRGAHRLGRAYHLPERREWLLRRAALLSALMEKSPAPCLGLPRQAPRLGSKSGVLNPAGVLPLGWLLRAAERNAVSLSQWPRQRRYTVVG